VTVAVPAPDGVNKPADVMIPFVAVQLTPVLNVPAPVTLAEQDDVCVVRIDDGVQVTATDVIADEAFTATVAEPDLVAS
jgi:hypothetical protein